MVTHPYCGFSRRAFQDFDEETKNYLSTNGVLIAPVNKKYEEEQLGGVLEWNKKPALVETSDQIPRVLQKF